MPTIPSATPDPSALPAYLAADHLIVEGPLTPVQVASIGGALPRGAVLGQVTAGGGYVLCDPTVTPPDGSQTPIAILADPGNAGLGVQPTVYLVGTFNLEWLLFHPGMDNPEPAQRPGSGWHLSSHWPRATIWSLTHEHNRLRYVDRLRPVGLPTPGSRRPGTR